MKTIDLSIPRRQYNNIEHSLTICPECDAKLIKENCTILLYGKSDSDEGEFITNLSGSCFCEECPVVVFDNDKVTQAAIYGIRGDRNFFYGIVGIVDLESIPDHLKNDEIGTDENPVPLVEFLPDLIQQQLLPRKNPVEMILVYVEAVKNIKDVVKNN